MNVEVEHPISLEFDYDIQNSQGGWNALYISSSREAAMLTMQEYARYLGNMALRPGDPPEPKFEVNRARMDIYVPDRMRVRFRHIPNAERAYVLSGHQYTHIVGKMAMPPECRVIVGALLRSSVPSYRDKLRYV